MDVIGILLAAVQSSIASCSLPEGLLATMLLKTTAGFQLAV